MVRLSDLVVLTPELLDRGKNYKGGFNAKQLQFLGEAYPLRSGWRARLHGKTVTLAEYEAFVEAKTPTPASHAEVPSGPGLFSNIIEPTAAYCDGGLIGINPSPAGGTWAYLHVESSGAVVLEHSGVCTPQEWGMQATTNNFTELLAAVLLMESLPEFWAGTIYTDSQITLWRIERRSPQRKPAGMQGIPEALKERVDNAKRRLGHYTVSLLGGHPTDPELLRGMRTDGLPCSKHNVRCDELCNLAGLKRNETIALSASK